MKNRFIDSHAHLYSDKFQEDLEDILGRAKESGVYKIVLPNIDVSSIDSMLKLAEANPGFLFPAMGLHPCSVDDKYELSLNKIRKHLESKTNKWCAVGEMGMDLYWDKQYVEEQKKAFKIQVEWAKEFDLPIIIHAREAFKEIFELLDEINDNKLRGVFHCFTGGKSEMEKILSYNGFYVGAGGVLTYPKANLGEVFKETPLEFILLETDAPYLPPVPYRGKRNESSYVPIIAEELAKVMGLSVDTVAEITTKNSLALFNI